MTYLAKVESIISLNYFLYFIDKYLDGNFYWDIQKISIWFHLKWKNEIYDFKKILELENYWLIIIKDLKLEENNNNDSSDKFKNYMEKFRLHQNKWLINEFTKNSNIIWKIKNKLWLSNKISVKKLPHLSDKKNNVLIELDSFSSILIYKNWEKFQEFVPKFTVFVFDIIVNNVLFYDILFSLIYNEKKDSKLNEVKNLYNNIISETQGKNNYKDEIRIFYDFNDYLDNKASIYPILYELEKNHILKISKITLENWYIYFYLKKINNLSIDKFDKSYNISKRKVEDKSNFNNGKLYINWEEIKFRNKNISKTFNLLKLFFETQKIKNKSKITFEELEELYKENNYKWLIKSKFNYEDLRKIIEDFNSRVFKIHNIKNFIVVNKSWLSCDYSMFS